MGKKSTSVRANVAHNTLIDAAEAHRRGDLAAARRLYRKVLKAQPHHPKALRLAGVLAYESGRTEEALRLLGAAARHAPRGDSGPFEDLGLVYLQNAEHSKAEDALRRALEINPQSLPALTQLGSALVTSGRSSEAVEAFRRARALDAEDAHVAYGLAHALLEDKQFEAALAASEDVLASRPDDPANLIVKGVALFQLGRFADAERALARCVERESGDVNAWIHLGRVRVELGDRDGAIGAFTRAAEIAPDAAMAHSQLANAYAAFGQSDRAVEACDAFLARHPASAALLVVKALALRDAGRGAEADAISGLDKLILEREIEAPSGYASVAAFNAALEAMIMHHPNLGRVLTNRATRHGVHTDSLTHDGSREVRDFMQLVNTGVRTAQSELRAAGLGDHPWVAHAPQRWKLNLWAVVLNDRGHQLSHIHPQAWMSGVYYVSVPEDGMGPGHGEDGWIEFGRPSEQLFTSSEPPVVSVEPRPGLLVMFPSYTFHRTKPFTSQGRRISIAFDVFTEA